MTNCCPNSKTPLNYGKSIIGNILFSDFFLRKHPLYKMEEAHKKDKTTEVSSSGVQWYLSLFLLLIVGLFFYGVQRRR